MRLRALHLTNFRQHADTRIEFGAGITGIIGNNGTGKTTIFEAIAWALYGNEAARGRRDSIRFARADAKAPVRVELEFELAGHRYRIVRGLSSAELYLDGGDEPIANSITTVTEAIHRRLGMSRAEFFNTYFTGQKELSVMTAFGPTERGQFLSRVLGYERLRTAQEIARNRRRELVAEVTGLKQAMPDPDAIAQALATADARLAAATARAADARAARDAARAALSTIAPEWEAAQQGRTHRVAAAAELRIAEQDIAGRTRDAARASGAVAEADAATTELATLATALAPLSALAAERESLDALAREDGRRQALTEAVRAASDEISRLVERRELLAAAARSEEEVTIVVEARRADLQAIRVTCEAGRTEWVRDKQEAETKRESLRAQYADIKSQREHIVSLGEDGTCPTCRRPLGTHFRSVLDVLDEQLNAVKLDGNYFKRRVEQLKAPPSTLVEAEAQRDTLAAETAALERRLADAQAAARELGDVARTVARQEQRVAAVRAELATLPTGYDASRHTVVRRELERLAPLEQRAARLALVAERATSLRAELAASQDAVRVATGKADALRAALGDGEDGDRAFDELRAAYERAADALRDGAVSVASTEAELAAARETSARAAAVRDELARTEARLTTITRERRLHDELDQAYTDVRTDLNFALRPEISKLASGFLAQLTDDRYTELDLDDQYNLVIVEDGSAKSVISGGEEDLANLVLRLAISQMIADRAGQAFSLLILDEVFGSLDDVRRQNVVDLLRRLHDRFEQVVLITHIEAVRDGCDQVLSVRYDAASGAAVVQPYEVEPLDAGLLAEAQS